MEERTFFEILDRFVDDGCLEFVQGDRTKRVGRNGAAPDAVVRIMNPRFFKRVLAQGNLGMGEAFMDHDFEMEKGTVTDFLMWQYFLECSAAAAFAAAGALYHILFARNYPPPRTPLQRV